MIIFPPTILIPSFSFSSPMLHGDFERFHQLLELSLKVLLALLHLLKHSIGLESLSIDIDLYVVNRCFKVSLVDLICRLPEGALGKVLSI